MRTIAAEKSIVIPEGIKLECKGRLVRVKGPRGTLERSFTHTTTEMEVVGNRMYVRMWHGKKKQLSVCQTICAHVKNMIVGVTKGFKYNMRFVYAHFPINATVPDDGSFIELRNFMGEKRVRRIAMIPGVKVVRSEKVKDQIELSGNNVDDVSLSAARVHQSILVKDKDIRKYLDGVYVSERGTVIEST